MIEVSQRKRPAVLEKIESDSSRDIGERSIPIVGIKDIAFITAPGVIGADKVVYRIPALFVSAGWPRSVRGICHHLSPEEAVQIFADWARYHSIGDIEIRMAIMIEVQSVA